MSAIPDDIKTAAREALHEALRDKGCGVAIQMALHTTSKAAFENAIARALLAERLAERERCAKVAQEELSIWKSVFPDIAPESVLPDRSKLEAENALLREAIARARAWHESEDKALSKSGRADADYYWRRAQHREQIDEIRSVQSDDVYNAAWEAMNARDALAGKAGI